VTLKSRLALDIIAVSHNWHSAKEAWLANLLEAAAPALPPGVLLALETDLTSARPRSEIICGPNADPAHAAFLRFGHGAAPDWCVKATYGSGRSWISLRECVPDGYFQRADWLEDLRAFRLADMLGVVSRQDDPQQPSCALFSLCSAPAAATRVERRLWDQVALHLGVAQRLRAAVEEPPDAVLGPDGTLLDATPAAASKRSRLRDLVRAREKVHARVLDRDVEQMFDVWEELATARWSLVDHFDTDGRRYIVARRNPSPGPLRRLTSRERQVAEFVAQGRTNDWIGAELGLCSATISEHLSNVQRKLGLGSRYELIQLVSATRRAAQGSEP
jgi:DNA-binding CsgD family transcriptional regulator